MSVLVAQATVSRPSQATVTTSYTPETKAAMAPQPNLRPPLTPAGSAAFFERDLNR